MATVVTALIIRWFIERCGDNEDEPANNYTGSHIRQSYIGDLNMIGLHRR